MNNDDFMYRLIAWSIEFEGSIEVKKREREDNSNPYSTEIRILNTEIELIKEFKRIIKIGHIDNGIEKYTWRFHKNERNKYAPLIYPYLISKQEQMQLVIEANIILKNKYNTLTHEEVCSLESLYCKSRELNERGKIKTYDYDYNYTLHKKQFINKYYNMQLLAFAIDWEGWISISRKLTKNDIYIYWTDVSIGNTERPILETFYKIIKFGHINGPYLQNKKFNYNWSLSRKETEKYLPDILTHLTMKWRQAELVIETNQILKTKEYVKSLPNHLRSMNELYTKDEVYTLNDNWKECKLLNDKYENMKRKRAIYS